MTARAVHFHEGMFLQPHHFQAEHRHVTERLDRAVRWPRTVGARGRTVARRHQALLPDPRRAGAAT